MRSINDRDGP